MNLNLKQFFFNCDQNYEFFYHTTGKFEPAACQHNWAELIKCLRTQKFLAPEGAEEAKHVISSIGTPSDS